GVAANSLWPHTTIATAAVNNLLGGAEPMARSRTAQIVADAAWAGPTPDPRQVTGNRFIDHELLRERGVTAYSARDHDTSGTGSLGHGPDDLELDLFLDEEGARAAALAPRARSTTQSSIRHWGFQS